MRNIYSANEAKKMTSFCNEVRETGLKKRRHEEEEKMNEGTQGND